jgi:hypothetical protein
VPLRSVEAATRDDAIAAAREQFGVTARVVGVRRVRSGGVLGFFATERYVAEVDPEPAARPVLPVPTPSRAAAERRPPRDDAARPAVPTRNGAAAYAEARATPPAARLARRDDDVRVDELAGLLVAATPAAFPGTSGNRSAAVPPSRPEPEPVRPAVVRPAAVRPAWSELLSGTAPSAAAPVPASAAVPAPAADPQPLGSAAPPSPFTAALARMVAGDRDVQQAVEDALAAPGDAMPGSEPTWSEPLPTAQTTGPPSVAHREEEPVELQDWTPSSTSFDAPAAAPAWGGAAPAAPAASSREEAIAEVLRAALDEGRSDEALAGILRKVMDGASPAAALAEMPAVLEPVAEPTVVPVMVVAEAAFEAASEPVAELVVEPAAEAEPVAVAAPVDAPVVLEAVPEAPAESFVAVEPVEAVAAEWSASDLLASGSELGWDDADSSSLWADVAPAVPQVATQVAVETDLEAVQETVQETVQAEVEEAALEEAPVAQTAVEPVVEEPVVEETVAEEAVQAPVLARTASDPAPLSLDATSVMPPLSLLPPLPSSRRGGRPPVPPSAHRGASARSTSRPSAPAEEREPSAATGRSEALATVTRLPLVPAAETPTTADEDVVAEIPAAPVVASPVPEEPAAVEPAAETPVEQTAVLPPVVVEPAVERPRSAAPARRPAVVVPAPAPRAERPRPAVARRPVPAAPGDLVSRLAALGLPEDLLDADFAAEAATSGTYAALTRALAGRLPETPTLPSGAGEVLVVVGPGVETLRAARALAATLRLDTDRVQWATRGDLTGLVPAGSRMATVEAAIERRQEAIGSGTLTIVAVDAPLRTDAYWTAQMLAIWAPVAVWAVVEATRKPEDLGPWVQGLPRVDALIVQDTDLSADPAAVLHRVALPLDLPVAVVDGMRATPHRWASLLCERLESSEG